MLKINTFEDLTKRLILEDLAYSGTIDDLRSLEPATKEAREQHWRALRRAKLPDAADIKWPITQKAHLSRGSYVRSDDSIISTLDQNTIRELSERCTNGGDIRKKIEKWEQHIDSDIELIERDIKKITSGNPEERYTYEDPELTDEVGAPLPPYQLTAFDVIDSVEELKEYIEKKVGSYTVAPEHAQTFIKFKDNLKNKLLKLEKTLYDFSTNVEMSNKERTEVSHLGAAMGFLSEKIENIEIAGADAMSAISDNIVGLFPDQQTLNNFIVMRVLTNLGLVKGPFRSLSQVDRLHGATSRANKKSKQIERFFADFSRFKNTIEYINNSDDIVNIMDTIFKNSAHNVMEKTGIDIKNLLAKIIVENKAAVNDWSFFFDIPENLDNELLAFLALGQNTKLKQANQQFDKKLTKQTIDNINANTKEDVENTQKYMHAYAKTMDGSEGFAESFFVDKKEFSLLAEENDDDYDGEFDFSDIDIDYFDDEDVSGAEARQNLHIDDDNITNKLVGDVIAKSDKKIAQQSEKPDAELLAASEKFKLSDEDKEIILAKFHSSRKVIIDLFRFFESIKLTPKEALLLLNFLQRGAEVYFDEYLHKTFIDVITEDFEDADIEGEPYGIKEYEKSMLRAISMMYKSTNRQYVIDMLEKAVNNIENCTTEDLVNYIKNDPTAERIREILPTIASFNAETLNAKNFSRPYTLIDSLAKDQFTTVLVEDLQVSLLWLTRRIIGLNAHGPYKGMFPGGFTIQNILKYIKLSPDITAARARYNLKKIYNLDISALETDEQGDIEMFKTFDDFAKFLYLNDANLIDAGKTFKRRYRSKKRDASGISMANINNIVSIIKKAVTEVKKYDIKAGDEELIRYIADCLANITAFQAELMISTSTKPKEFQSRIRWGAFINQAIKELQKKYGINQNNYSNVVKTAADYLYKAKDAMASKASVPVINFTGSKMKHITLMFYTPESAKSAYADMGSIVTADGRTIKKGEQGEPFRGPKGEVYETITRSSLKRFNTHEEYIDILSVLPEEEPDITEDIKHVPDHWIPSDQQEDYDKYILAPAIKNEAFAFSIYQAICWFLTNKVFYSAKGGQAQSRVKTKGLDIEKELEKAINELREAAKSVRRALPHSVDIERILEKKYGRWLVADIEKYIGNELFEVTGAYANTEQNIDHSLGILSLICVDKIVKVMRDMYDDLDSRKLPSVTWGKIREHVFAQIAADPNALFARGKYRKLAFSFHNTPNILEDNSEEYGWDINGLEIKFTTTDDSDLNQIFDSEENIRNFILTITKKIKNALVAAGSEQMKSRFIRAYNRVKNPIGISLDSINIGEKYIEYLPGVNDEDETDRRDDNDLSSNAGYSSGRFSDEDIRVLRAHGAHDGFSTDDGFSIIHAGEDEEEVLMAVAEMEPEITLVKPHHKKEKCKCKKMLPNKDRFKHGYERINRQYEDFFRRH